jgi:hypothetical protein
MSRTAEEGGGGAGSGGGGGSRSGGGGKVTVTNEIRSLALILNGLSKGQVLLCFTGTKVLALLAQNY